MRLPDAVHEAGPWRIREIVPDFTLEDVWQLPIHGTAEDRDAALGLIGSLDPSQAGSLPARALWALRDQLGRWLDLGRISGPAEQATATRLPIPGTQQLSLAERLPEDLRAGGVPPRVGSLPFTPLYRTEDEYAAEISNRTVHGVLHLAWTPEGGGRYGAQMAVYVKPRGHFGKAYMALIRPFRYAIVYPALMRQVERTWQAREQRASQSQAS